MVTCLLAIVVESRYPSRQELTALIVLTMGVMLAVWQARWACVAACCRACGGQQQEALCTAVRPSPLGALNSRPQLAPSAGSITAPPSLPSLPALPRCSSIPQGTVSGKPYAIAFCLVGMVCNGAMMTFSGKVLGESLDVVRLTFYTAPVSLACLAPFFWVYEASSRV